MRSPRLVVAALSALAPLAACGEVSTAIDAAPTDAFVPDGEFGTDAPIDAPAIDACTTRTIFVGGMDPAMQGWTVHRSGTASISTFGPTITQLQTQTAGGSGAYQLLSMPDAITPGAPFRLEISLQVTTADPHNFLDAPVAIMGRYTGGFGDGTDRGQMIYIDRGQLGWADDTQAFTASSTDTFHSYLLEVDAGGTATVSRDGVAVLTRQAFMTNGTIAFGDQTNDASVESTILVRSVSLLCP